MKDFTRSVLIEGLPFALMLTLFLLVEDWPPSPGSALLTLVLGMGAAIAYSLVIMFSEKYIERRW